MPDSTDIPALIAKVREAQSTLRDFGLPTAGRQRSWDYLATAAPVLADEVERLREALRLYGRHLPNCGIHGHYAMIGEPYECNCGLKQLQEAR